MSSSLFLLFICLTSSDFLSFVFSDGTTTTTLFTFSESCPSHSFYFRDQKTHQLLSPPLPPPPSTSTNSPPQKIPSCSSSSFHLRQCRVFHDPFFDIEESFCAGSNCMVWSELTDSLHFSFFRNNASNILLWIDTLGLSFLIQRANFLLFSAVEGGHLDLVRFMLDQGFPPDVFSEPYGDTPLMIVSSQDPVHASRGKLSCRPPCPDLEMSPSLRSYLIGVDLLQHGSNPNTKNFFGSTSLHVAASSRSLHMMEELLFSGGSPNVADDKGITPVHIASEQVSLGLISMLLEAGADPSVVDSRGQNALHFLCASKYFSGVISSTSSVSNRSISVPSSQENDNSSSPHHDVRSRLLIMGSAAATLLMSSMTMSEINRRDLEFGRTPLHYCSQNDLFTVVKELLRHGASPNILDDKGFSPLMLTVHPFYVTSSLEILVNFSRCKNNSALPVSELDSHGIDNHCQQLPENIMHTTTIITSTDLKLRCRMGRTILHYAAERNSSQTVRYLLKHGKIAVVDQLDDQGNSPLHLASERGFSQVVTELLGVSADANLRNHAGAFPLLLAAACGTQGASDTLRLLHNRNPKSICCTIPEYKGFYNITPLMTAALSGSGITLHTLLEFGVDPSYGDCPSAPTSSDKFSSSVVNKTMTAMHLCLLSHNSRGLRVLRKAGAPSNLRNGKGKTVDNLIQELMIDRDTSSPNKISPENIMKKMMWNAYHMTSDER